MTDKTFGTFFLPGPTEVHPAVLQAMTQPMIGHRVAEMEELIGHIQPRLQSIFRTTRPVYISASSATGLMEGAVRNGALRRVLCLVNGAFSERFHQITQATGLEAEALTVDWGQGHTPEMLESALAGGGFDAVTVVHSETSTGVLNPIRELAQVAHAAGDVVLLVDSVSGAAGADIRTDEWGLDFILTGSQKSFALPPGLAFGVAQPNILERAKQKPNRGIYFDFLEFERNILANQTPNTPAVSLLYALKEQVDRIAADGIENRLERHRAMAERLWQWCDEKGLEILADANFRAPTVTAIRCPSGWTGPTLAAAVKKEGYSIATGYGRMKDETFRIGHMGDHTVDGLNGLLEALGRVLDKMKPFRVFVADAISVEGLAPLREDGRFELDERAGLKGEDLTAAIEGAHAVIVRSSTRITRESLARADQLRVIGRAGVGVDNIDVDAATERGVAVLNAPSGNTISAAELTFALILACVRRIPAADRSMKAGEWDRKSFTGTELHAKTLGLVGAGRIGGEVARRARAFGMRVHTYDPYLSADRAEALEMELMPLEQVLTSADVISLHVPLTESTQGLIGVDEIARMKKGTIIVNAARGGVIDEAALADGIRSGHLGGAALDVYAEEPLPAEHPLRGLANVVLTPHLGAATGEAQHNVALEIAEAVRAALVDGDLTRAVNAPAIGGEEMRRLRPLLELAERLGRIAVALSDGPVENVLVRYSGQDDSALRPVAAAVVTGTLQHVVGRGAVNPVNALHLAETRGTTVERSRVGAHGPNEEFVEVRLRTASGDARVAGAVVAGRHPRVVRIDRYRIMVRPRGALVIVRNRDVPGVIGRVGTLLGSAGINIAEYQQARVQAGEEALAAISTDGWLDEAALRSLADLEDVLDVRQIDLD